MEMPAIKRMLRWWPLLLLCCALRSAGQDALRKPVSLPASPISAEQLRKEVSRQTGLQFSFGSHTIRPGQLFRFRKRTYAAKDLLIDLQQQLGADYKVYHDHVIFTKRPITRSHPPISSTRASGTPNHGAKTQTHLRDRPAHVSDRPTDSRDRPAHVPDRPTDSRDRTAHPADRRAHPGDTLPHVADRRAHLRDGPAHPKDGRSYPGDRPTHPKDRRAYPGDGNAHPKDAPTDKKAISTLPPDGPGGEKNANRGKLSQIETRNGAVDGSPDGKSASNHRESSRNSSRDGTLDGAITSIQADERVLLRVNNQAKPRRFPEETVAPQKDQAAAPEKKSRPGFGGGIFTRYTAAGLEVTEYFPANAVFKGGIPLLHGIIGYSSNFAHGSLRYGGGTRWAFGERWHVQAHFTTGKVTKQFDADSSGFAQKKVKITERLQRIGLQAERTIGARWSLVAGGSWNMLSRVNTQDGARLAPGDRIFNDPVPQEGYRAVKPLYTTSSSFHDGSKTWKDAWPGVQAGVYFRF